MSTRLYAVTDADGRPLRFFMTAGEVSNYTSAAALTDSLRRPSGCLPTEVMMLTGSETR